MKRKRMLLLSCLMMMTAWVFAQNQTITGKVVSAEDGQVVIGAYVMVKGTTQGTVSDVDGKFSLSVPQGATLQVSYMGMITQEVPAQNGMTVRLQVNVKELDEVLMIGYGAVTRSQFVGSAASIDGEKLQARSVSNLTNALQGAAAGVQVVNGSGQPGTGASIRIRGVGSISGGKTPLYVVDGVPYDESSINLISSSDIESMSVLKDAATTAIYGARGANGVVLITTKSGNNQGKNTVNLEAKWGRNSRAVPNYNVMTDPAMYYETAYRAMYNSQIAAGLTPAEAYKYADDNFLTQTGVGYLIYTVPTGERLIGTNFKLNPHATLGYSDGDYYYTPDDWGKEILRSDNLRQEYAVTVQGGNKETQYFISAGYLDDPGLINGSGFTRYTLRSKIDSQVKKWLKVGASMAFAQADLKSPSYQTSWGSTSNVFYSSNMMAPIYPFYVRNADGSLKVDANGYTVYDSGTFTNFIRPGSAPRGNNAINLLIDDKSAISDNLSGNFYATFTPMEGLSFTARVSPESYNVRSRNLSNPFYGSTTTQGAVSVGHDRLFIFNQQYLANFKKSFAKIHKLEVLAGYEAYSLTEQSLVGVNDILFNPFIGELNNAYGVEPTSNNVGSNTDVLVNAGFLGRLQYDLLDRYFFNATLRHEASSRFAPDKRWGTFGSVGAAWLLSAEDFMQDADFIDELKVKVSYGTQGNDQIGSYYAYRDMYSIAYNSETKEFSKSLSSKGNPNLTWEAQKLFNAGVEFSLFDRLDGSIEYFSRLNSDMLFNVPMPPSTGYSNEPQNVGSLLNNGWEIDLNYTIVKAKNVNWSINANLTRLYSKILSLPEYAKQDGIKYSSYIIKENGSLYQAYMQQYAGIDKTTGQMLYYVDPDNGNYSTTTDYTAAKQADLGDVGVKFFGGFGTSLEAFGFDLSAQLSYQLGGMAYDGGYQELMHAGAQIGRNWHTDILNAWTPENTDTNVPRLNTADDFDQNVSSRWLVSSDYLSLNNITLGYTLPKKFTEKMQINKLRLFCSGDNLALFSARQGFDPRQSQNAGSTGLSISTSSGNYVYSQMRVVSAGVSLTF